MSKELKEKHLEILTDISGYAIGLNYDLRELSDEEFFELLGKYNDAFTKVLTNKISN